MMAGLILASALDGREILAVRCERAGDGVVLKILMSEALDGVETERTGEGAVVMLPAAPPRTGLELPQALPPLRSIAFEAGTSRARMRVTWLPGTTLESRIEGSLVTIHFRSSGAKDEPSPSRDVEQLYPLLFPHAAPDAPAPPSAPEEGPAEAEARGLGWGPFRISPGLVLRYIDASATYLNTPQPVSAQYFEVQPTLSLTSSIFGTRLSLGYEPRFRSGEEGIPVLSEPSHFFTAGLERPVGTTWLVSVSDQLHRGTIETQILDPGREYFFNVGTFRRNEVALALRSESAGRFDWDFGGRRATESVEPGTGYFGNVRETLFVGTRFEVGVAMKALLRYELERVPPPEMRPFVESRAHGLLFGLEGDVSPSLKANITAGLRSESHPRAPAGGDRFRGLTYSGSLRREMAAGANLTLGASRNTQLSAFESNAFYVASSVNAVLNIPLPFGAQLSTGSGYQWNDYRLDAQGLSEPRHDRLFAWSAGVGRSITRWSFARVDYNWDRRRSNVPELNTRTHSFMVQLGLGASSIGFR